MSENIPLKKAMVFTSIPKKKGNTGLESVFGYIWHIFLFAFEFKYTYIWMQVNNF